jgi:hypothetical protein
MEKELTLTPGEYIATERMLAEIVIAAALSCTEFGKYYPDADVTVRFRHGKVLPVIEINRKVDVGARASDPKF